MKRALTFMGLIGVVAVAAMAQEDKARIKATMHKFLAEYSKMSSYTANEESFQSDHGKKVVGDSLKSLTAILKDPPAELQDSQGFRITFGLLSDHVTQTNAAFNRGEYAYARMRVNAIGNFCASCHMQAPRVSSVMTNFKEVNLANAEFLFVIRRYDAAMKMYDTMARGYPKNQLSTDKLYDIYRRKLAIFARVYRNSDAAIDDLTMDLKNKGLPADVRETLTNWLAELKKWKTENVNPSKLKTPELVSYVAKNFPNGVPRKIAPYNPELLNLLRLSGLLYERLYSEKNGPHAQALLYYLAQCERALSPLYWYPLSEIYLKSCVSQFPKTPYTQKCVDAYEAGMEEQYAGRTMPDFIKEGIEAAKALAQTFQNALTFKNCRDDAPEIIFQ